jgi:hypothetical protein
VLRCSENRQTFRSGVSHGLLSHIRASIAWRTSVGMRRRGSSPVARRGARQRAGLTPVSASNTLSCQRETLHTNQINLIKNPLDRDHGIYRVIQPRWSYVCAPAQVVYRDAAEHCRWFDGRPHSRDWRARRPFDRSPTSGSSGPYEQSVPRRLGRSVVGPALDGPVLCRICK